MKSNVFGISLTDLENLNSPLGDENTYKDFKEKFERLDPESKELIVREAVRQAIRKYGSDGLTVDEIIQLTSHGRKAVQKHLDSLISLREVYSQKRNKKLTLYFPNGKPLHSVSKKRLEWDNGNNIFEISLASGPKDKLFFHILEKRFSILDGEVSEGAILVPLDSVDALIEGLKELQNEVRCIEYE
jgi:hypothetical protein